MNFRDLCKDVFTGRENQHVDHVRVLYFLSWIMLNVFQGYALWLGQEFSVASYGEANFGLHGVFAVALGLKQLGGTG